MGEVIGLDDADACFMGHAEGLYVGQLDAAEMELFGDLCRRGLMRRSYSHAGGLLGLAKIETTDLGTEALRTYLAPAARPADALDIAGAA